MNEIILGFKAVFPDYQRGFLAPMEYFLVGKKHFLGAIIYCLCARDRFLITRYRLLDTRQISYVKESILECLECLLEHRERFLCVREHFWR